MSNMITTAGKVWTIINRHDDKIYNLTEKEFKYLLDKEAETKEYRHRVKLLGIYIEREGQKIWIDAEINKQYLKGAF